jgi:pyruvate dehydrogenase (quinone)
VAEATGLFGVRIEQSGDVRDAPALIVVVVEPHALTPPPHITLGQAEGCALAISKEVLLERYADVVDTILANQQLRP